MATKKQMVESLSGVALFERCTKRDLRIIARHLEEVRVVAGQEVVSRGEHGEAFFLVLGGELAVQSDGADPVVLAAGDHFGELALLDPGPRSATVIALTDGELGVLGVRMFRVLLRDVPHIAAELLASLARQLREARSVNVA